MPERAWWSTGVRPVAKGFLHAYLGQVSDERKHDHPIGGDAAVAFPKINTDGNAALCDVVWRSSNSMPDKKVVVTHQTCPVEPFAYITTDRPALTALSEAAALRSKHSAFRVDEAQGYWVLTEYESILEAYQNPTLFSSQSMVATDPEPPYKWIPEMLDPPEHTVWRRLLSPFFTPGAVESLTPHIEERCIELIEGIAAKRECDFVAEFALRFPTTIFLELMGMPVALLDEFLVYVEQMLRSPDESNLADTDAAPVQGGATGLAAMMNVMAAFADRMNQLRKHPAERAGDILSQAVTWQINGEPIPEEDLLSFCGLMFVAGLDTVAAQLSYSFHHLATHPSNRQRIIDDPEVIRKATEELLRAFPIVQPSRKVVHDTEFRGCQMKAGDMVMLPLRFAGTDPAEYENPEHVDFDRSKTRHLSFGAGPHRCVGSHLARREISIALREWHKRIPHYHIANPSAVVEHTGGVLGIEKLPLVW